VRLGGAHSIAFAAFASTRRNTKSATSVLAYVDDENAALK